MVARDAIGSSLQAIRECHQRLDLRRPVAIGLESRIHVECFLDAAVKRRGPTEGRRHRIQRDTPITVVLVYAWWSLNTLVDGMMSSQQLALPLSWQSLLSFPYLFSASQNVPLGIVAVGTEEYTEYAGKKSRRAR